MNPCLPPLTTLPPLPGPWALPLSLRTVLMVGARGPQLDGLAWTLRRAGFLPTLCHSGNAALERIVQEPIPALLLVHWGNPAEGTEHWLRMLQHVGALGWFSLIVVGGPELPPGVHAQARLASDCTPSQLVAVMEEFSA